jgi:hypothetical protein
MGNTSRPTTKNIELFSKAPFWRRLGFGLDETKIDDAYSNNYVRKYASADGQNDIEAMRVDADDQLRIGGEGINPMRATINFPLATNGSLTTQCFFIAPYVMEITGISCVYATADGATNTGWVTHETGTVAPGSGNTVQIGTFNLNTTVNTVQNATLPAKFPTAGTEANYADKLILAKGDRLSFTFKSAVTSLAGLVVTVYANPGGKGFIVPYVMNKNGDLADQTFFVANRDFVVTAAYYVHSTKGTGSADYVQLVKDTGTNAPGAGTDLLTNNTNSGFSTTAAVNTVQTGTLSATAANLRLAPGDRLSVDYATAVTSLAGVVLIVVLRATDKRKEVTYTMASTANQNVNTAFFVADRDYEIIAASEIHSVAHGATNKLQLTRDTGTNPPGDGTDLLSNNTNAGFDLNGTANTVQTATFVDTRYNFLMAGDRLSVDPSATSGSTLAGLTVTVSLVPR